jgi:hypothetical protein
MKGNEHGAFQWHPASYSRVVSKTEFDEIPQWQQSISAKYSRTPVSTGNTFQDLPRGHETADNTER